MSGGGVLSNGHNLTVEREFRYIVQWFTEWSEFQREDFVPVLAAQLATVRQGQDQPVYVNGIISAMAAVSSQDKPMSLFQCRVKLFNEWCSKWPEGQSIKLLERLSEIDADFGHEVQLELSGNGRSTRNSDEPFTHFSDDPEEPERTIVFPTPVVTEHHSNGNNVTIVSITAPEPDLIHAEPIALVIGED